MARPSKLSDLQWTEIERRLGAGEVLRDLAREFQISPSRISEHCSARLAKQKALAQELVTVEDKIHSLPVSEQHAVRSLADSLHAISRNYAQGADKCSQLFNKMAGLAMHHADQLTARGPNKANSAKLDHIDRLVTIGAKAATPVAALMAATRNYKEPPKAPQGLDDLTNEQLVAIIQSDGGAGAAGPEAGAD